MVRTDKKIVGDWGERKAAFFLLQKKYKIIRRNWQVRQGEIDIIAWHHKKYCGRTLCFIEVKTRRRDDGSAERATRYHKIKKIQKAAMFFCIRHGISIEKTPIQFEQVSVYLGASGESSRIKHYVIPVN